VPRPRRHPRRRLERREEERKKPVNTIDDAALVEALRQQMTKSVARQVAASGNLANVDTPNFKAVEPTFADALKGQLQMTATRANHINPANPNTSGMREIQDAAARRDGNTVELDRELLTMQRANGDFAAAQTALAAKFKLVRYAISESK
jgi:flagellar basal-body rod protein FlgB